MFALASAILMLQTYLTTSIYSIGGFNETIVNPSFPGHEIPVYVYYPITTNKSVTFPSIIFAHGFACNALWYTWIYQDIVPSGYIVAYIDSETGDSLNGTQFAIDQRYTFEWLVSIANNNKSSPLYSHIDTTTSMAAGHSEGGGSSILSTGNMNINQLFNNKYKFSSIFTMAPCGQGGSNVALDAANIDVPIFVFTGTMDCGCPSPEAHHIFDNIPNTVCKYYVDVTNATHCHWLNAPLFWYEECTEGEKWVCKELHPDNDITIPLKQQLSIASQYMQLFLTATVIHGDNKNYFNNITNQLNTAKSSGQMSEVIVSTAC